MTHTFAELAVPRAVYDVVFKLLHDAKYHHALNGDGGPIDMHGIGLVPEAEEVHKTTHKDETEIDKERLAKIHAGPRDVPASWYLLALKIAQKYAAAGDGNERRVSELQCWILDAMQYAAHKDAARTCGTAQGLRAALNACLDFLQSAPLESGVCCCGSPVKSHSLGDGHAPVDDLSYHASQLAERVKGALAAIDLCDDEGCPHYGTPHVCVSAYVRPAASSSSTLKAASDALDVMHSIASGDTEITDEDIEACKAYLRELGLCE